MAFTVKDWKDSPDTSTPLSAAALEDLETRVAGYTDQQITSLRFAGVGDGRMLTDAAITSGSAVLTSASGPFVSGDVGKIVVVYGAGTGTPANSKGFTISSYQSATQVTLSTTASTTVSGATCFYGTDDATAFADAFTALTRGGVVQLEPRIYMVAAEVNVPGGVTVRGTGYSYPGDGTYKPSRGAMIVAGGSLTTRTVRVGDLQASLPVSDPSFGSDHTGAKIEDLIVLGANLVSYAVYATGARCRIDRCEIRHGITAALYHQGQNAHTMDCVIAQSARGTCVINGADDNKYYRNQVRGHLTNAMTVSGGNNEIVENHMFPDNAQDATAGAILKLTGSGTLVRGNVIGCTNLRAPDILIVGTTTTTHDIQIDGNHLYRTAPTSGSTAIPAIQIDTTSAGVDHLSITNNLIRGDQTLEANTGYKSMVDVTGANTVAGWVMSNNNGASVAAFVTAASGQAPGAHHGNLLRHDFGSGAVQLAYDQGIPANTQTTSYTLTLADASMAVEMNSASATTVTVPPNSSVAFPIGSIVEVARLGSGTVTIAAGAGVTIRSAGGLLDIGTQYGSVSLRKRAADEWVLVGDLA